MDDKNRELLGKVVEDRLKRALNSNPDEDDASFKEAMDAVDKQLDLDKIEASREQAKKDRLVQVGTFAAGLVVAPVIDGLIKRGFAKMLCTFEKDYTFTTTAGKTLSSLFRFKK